MRLNIHGLIDHAKCYQMVRQLRWADGVECPHCHATEVVKNGYDGTQGDRQRYLCRMCNRSFDDLTGTVFAGHHQSLSVWMLCLDFMGRNGATNINRYVMGRENRPEMKTAMDFMRFMWNTMEGFWSLLRSWLRPHRGISQERLPIYVGFFQFVHNGQQRGNSLLCSLVQALVRVNPVRSRANTITAQMEQKNLQSNWLQALFSH